MTRGVMLTGNAAAAWGARLAGVDYIPAFPITPQTEIIETLGAWIDVDELDARMVMLESEHSMVTAAGAAAVTGVRTFSATSSQGLLYAAEMLYTVAGSTFILGCISVLFRYQVKKRTAELTRATPAPEGRRIRTG